jgi:hypothetical protein
LDQHLKQVTNGQWTHDQRDKRSRAHLEIAEREEKIINEGKGCLSHLIREEDYCT